ncbi:uncharacterized protein LOC133763895 [Lepus europaeus]|uniref:uncharacterized protein LOC133763895 n=1 Tax=Lepus europaeus TaxID=9983 RepID=UPI002B49FFFC|nr:uncharacterized protein LOC133763895 [Lepus europaeus]
MLLAGAAAWRRRRRDPASGCVRRVGAAGRCGRAPPGGSPRGRRAPRAGCSWRELGARAGPGAAAAWAAARAAPPQRPPRRIAVRRAPAWRAGSERVSAGGGSGRARAARPGRQRLVPPARPTRPLSRSPPAPLHLLPASLLLPLSPRPPSSPSAGITCRHHTHWESLPRLSPRFRSNEDTPLLSSARPPRCHRPLLRGGAHRGPDATKGPPPLMPRERQMGADGLRGCGRGERLGAGTAELPPEPPWEA